MAFNRQAALTILGASAVAVSGAADVAENILATITVPAGAMGLKGILRIDTIWSFTNSANNKTLFVRLGAGGSTYLNIIHTTLLTARHLTMVTNRGVANSQVGMPGGKDGGVGASAGALTTSAVDTSLATSIIIAGQKALAGETLTLEAYLVELLLP